MTCGETGQVLFLYTMFASSQVCLKISVGTELLLSAHTMHISLHTVLVYGDMTAGRQLEFNVQYVHNNARVTVSIRCGLEVCFAG